MRPIIVSHDVFAALWSKRRHGEDSENAVLERLLGLPKGPPMPQPGMLTRPRFPRGGDGINQSDGDNGGGIFNHLFQVRFAEGFEIFRVYKGKEYSARVCKGMWVMEGQNYRSLFALSMAVSDSNENPWRHWKYRDAKDRINYIGELRKAAPESTEAELRPPRSASKPAGKTRRKPSRR